MDGDFLSGQLGACGHLDFVRFWIAGADADKYDLVAEVVREDGEIFSVTVPGARGETVGAQRPDLGFAPGGTCTVPGGADATADVVRAVLGATVPAGTRVSLTHGQRAELLDRRRLDHVVAEAHRILGAQAAPGAWTVSTAIPIQFRYGTVELTLWPKIAPPTVVLQVWALVALALPDRPEIGELVAGCNEAFNYGRLVRQDNRLWYRDVIHAEPLLGGPLDFAIQVAVNTAKQIAPQLVELGAVDGTAPEPSPDGALARPPDAGIAGPAGGYL